MPENTENQNSPAEPTTFIPIQDGTKLLQLSIDSANFAGEMKNSYATKSLSR